MHGNINAHRVLFWSNCHAASSLEAHRCSPGKSRIVFVATSDTYCPQHGAARRRRCRCRVFCMLLDVEQEFGAALTRTLDDVTRGSV